MSKKSKITQDDPLAPAPHILANCEPRGDRVVIRRTAKTTQTQGGILLPDTVKSKSQTGVVYAVGPGAYQNGVLVPVGLERGQRVIIASFAGLELRNEIGNLDDEFVMLRAEDVVACVHEDFAL